MNRAVERGLSRRNLDDIKHVGIDEKSFGKGHDYVSVMTDLDQGRVLEVVPDRTLQSTNKLWETLTDLQKLNVKAVAMDMWKAFMSATQSACPAAAIVHDKFHVSKYLGEAVDQVRRLRLPQLRQQPHKNSLLLRQT